MKTLIALSVICVAAVAFLVQCEKDPIPIPGCIQQKIDSVKNASHRSPPAEIHLWIYGGREVYLFNAPCCDQLTKVLDENCKYVCAPSGGPMKIGDSLCVDFYQEAKYVGSIWKDDR